MDNQRIARAAAERIIPPAHCEDALDPSRTVQRRKAVDIILAAIAEAQAAPMDSSAWEFACNWYRPDEIERSIASDFATSDPLTVSRRVPTDVQSREFAVWLCEQYRLAMNKGIQIGRSKMPLPPAPGA